MNWSFTLRPVFPLQKSNEGKICSISKAIAVEIEELIFCPISKSDEEERIVRAVILEPNSEMSEDDIRNESYHWMESRDWNDVSGSVHVLETMIAPTAMKINGQEVRKSSWVMTLKIVSDEIWEDFQRGEFKISGRSLQEI